MVFGDDLAEPHVQNTSKKILIEKIMALRITMTCELLIDSIGDDSK